MDKSELIQHLKKGFGRPEHSKEKELVALLSAMLNEDVSVMPEQEAGICIAVSRLARMDPTERIIDVVTLALYIHSCKASNSSVM
jgi:hypothetical protein